MATRVAWLLNFDADLELQDPVGYRPRPLDSERAFALAERLTDLLRPEDVVLAANRTGALSSDLTVQAFCPTPSALKRIGALKLTPPASPGLAVLRKVNDRSFCAALGHGLPHSCFARDMATLERHISTPSPTGTYVIKRAFSFAGREQRRVHGSALDASTRGFCARSFGRGEGVQVEPWVERLLDVSRHGYITRAGRLLVGATREQRCDAMGRFQGMSSASVALSPGEDEALEAEVRTTAAALVAAGYFGPFGIDGFRYRHGGDDVGLNPRCEINARFTMGYPRILLLQGLDAEGTHRPTAIDDA